jgi:hypothetical protein
MRRPCLPRRTACPGSRDSALPASCSRSRRQARRLPVGHSTRRAAARILRPHRPTRARTCARAAPCGVVGAARRTVGAHDLGRRGASSRRSARTWRNPAYFPRWRRKRCGRPGMSPATDQWPGSIKSRPGPRAIGACRPRIVSTRSNRRQRPPMLERRARRSACNAVGTLRGPARRTVDRRLERARRRATATTCSRGRRNTAGPRMGRWATRRRPAPAVDYRGLPSDATRRMAPGRAGMAPPLTLFPMPGRPARTPGPLAEPESQCRWRA